MTRFRIEAEHMNLSNYRVKSGYKAASGRNLISLYQSGKRTGTASYQFNRPAGLYHVVLGYFDENDGIANLKLRIGGTSVANWNLNQNLRSVERVRRTVTKPLWINKGTTIQLRGTANRAEWARVDYLEFVPVRNQILVGGAGSKVLDGRNGIYTVSYAQANKGVLVNLNTGVGFISSYKSPLKIMPLGDSITYGVIQSDRNTESGGYRTGLWHKFAADGLKVNFVGTLSNGPASLGDKNHEGHRGFKINDIAASVNKWLDVKQPNIILLTIGTNDMRWAGGLKTAPKRLSALVDQITDQLPNAQLLVASIPPISRVNNQRTVAFNSSIPNIVNSKVAQGKKVSFVNLASQLTRKDLADGIHPTVDGYRKIAEAWHDPILNAAGVQDTLRDIEDIVGSAFDDVLIGNAGVNVIQGGAGKDILTGGSDGDLFVYRAPTEGKDTITDFGRDDLFNISASGFGGGLKAGTALSKNNSSNGVFRIGSNSFSRGTNANFLYNTNTGLLKFDRDGTGASAALAIATLAGSPLLDASQFTITA